jgi:hypothetical protein
MKRCNWCGKEYPDDATACVLDARPLVPVGSQGTYTHEEVEQEPSAPTPDSAAHDAANKNMLVGGLWCLGGILVTAATYGAASNNPNGGSYVVAWGAIIFGAMQFFRGLSAANNGGRKFDPPASSPSSEAPQPERTISQALEPERMSRRKPWTCATCGEQLEPQFTTCWKCRSPRSEIA